MHEQIYIDISSYTCYQQALSSTRSVVNGKNEKTEWKAWKMNMLAKSKTWKGGLGKNEHPDGLTTSERRSRQKQGQQKKTIPRWVENPKGRSRQKWDDEKKNE